MQAMLFCVTRGRNSSAPNPPLLCLQAQMQNRLNVSSYQANPTPETQSTVEANLWFQLKTMERLMLQDMNLVQVKGMPQGRHQGRRLLHFGCPPWALSSIASCKDVVSPAAIPHVWSWTHASPP